MIQYHPDNPTRPVDWRWERARIVRENEKKLRIRDEDQWTSLAYRFQKDLAKCKTEIDQYALLKRYSTIYFAYMLRGNEEKKSITMRSEIEARILAGESHIAIASQCGCDPAVIDLYERLFFNVKEKLQNTAYILHQVMGPAIYKGLYERDHDLLWKLYGYFCGSKVIDALTSTFTKPVKAETPEQVDALFVDDTKAVMRRKAAISARTVAVNEFTQLRILEIYAQFLEIEKGSEAGQGESLILENIKTMMAALPFTTGIRAKKDERTKQLVAIEDQAAELRSDEMLLITAGPGLSNSDEIASLKFPEAPEHGEAK